MISFKDYINEHLLSESKGIALYNDIKKIKKLYQNIIYKIQPYLLTEPERITNKILIKNKPVEYSILKEPFIYTVDFNELGLTNLLKTKNFTISISIYDIECEEREFILDFFNCNIEKFNNFLGFTSISPSDKIENAILDKNNGQMGICRMYSLFGILNKPYFYETVFHEINHLYSQYKCH